MVRPLLEQIHLIRRDQREADNDQSEKNEEIFHLSPPLYICKFVTIVGSHPGRVRLRRLAAPYGGRFQWLHSAGPIEVNDGVKLIR